MKNRNLILSVLFWAVASCAWAITLPSSSYVGSTFDYEDYSSSSITVGSSRSIIGNYAASAYEGSCSTAAVQDMVSCCTGELMTKYGISLEQALIQNAIGNSEPLSYYDSCMSSQASLPLGTPLMLLPFIAVYAVLRKRKQA